LGALQAIEALGRQNEGIVIVGLDAIEPAREAIAAGGGFEATVAQDFAGAEDLRVDDHAIVPLRSAFAGLRSVVDLERLRRVLGRLRPRSGVEAAPERFELFEATLGRARALTFLPPLPGGPAAARA
jgi:hypothetical protein